MVYLLLIGGVTFLVLRTTDPTHRQRPNLYDQTTNQITMGFTEDELEEIQEAFECFCAKDKDDKPNGFIDKNGFDSVLRMLGGNPTEAQLAEMHKKLGKDKKITFDEFLPFWEQQSKDKSPDLDVYVYFLLCLLALLVFVASSLPLPILTVFMLLTFSSAA